jgi:hypothetical protein
MAASSDVREVRIMRAIRRGKVRIIVTVLAFAAFSATSLAWAESVDEVAARVSAARESGEIDQETYADLQVCLDQVRTAATPLDDQSAAEAYNLLAPASLAASFSP